MILPSSHSPARVQDHAMRAAAGEPCGGWIPMREGKPPSRLIVSRMSGVPRANRTIRMNKAGGFGIF